MLHIPQNVQQQVATTTKARGQRATEPREQDLLAPGARESTGGTLRYYIYIATADERLKTLKS